VIARAPAASARTRVLRVLIVDESVDDVRRIRDLLQETGGFLSHAARTAEEAETLLEGGSFDVALVDANIWSDPQSAFASYLRERRSDVAVVLLTNSENEREALPAMKLGAHDFLNKAHLDDGQLELRVLGAFEENRGLRRRDTMVRWLEREARTDHLTGLHNRHAFDERLRELSADARRDGSPITLLLADISGTRIVNDVHGHDAGDDMIRRTAIGISRCIRGLDFAARIGGDDFGIILPDGGLELGRLIARRIAHEIERMNNEEWADELPVNLTFGVASGTACDPAELFAAADQQLSQHKSFRPVVALFRHRDDSDGPHVA
jgi:two-component system, cell cycle response regulator